MDTVAKSRALMLRKTAENGAPAWALTEIAIENGRRLAKLHKVDKRLVLAALYLAHVVFSKKIGDKIRKNHEELSAKCAESYLKRWGVEEKKRSIILNAIRAHHNKVKTGSKIAEVMKNGECFKFLTIKGALAYFNDLMARGMTIKEAVAQVKYKAKEKLSYVTLKDIRQEVVKNYKEINSILEIKTLEKKLKICTRGHKFYRSTDYPICPKCWPGHYLKNMLKSKTSNKK